MTEKKDWKRRDLVPTERFIRRPVHPKGPTRREIANFGYRLTLAMAVLAGIATPQQAADAFLRFGGAGGSAPPSGLVRNSVINTTGSTVSGGMPVRFGQPHGDGAIPSGHSLEVTDGGGNILPAVFARRHYSGDTHPATTKVQGYVMTDVITRTKDGRTIAPSGSEQLTLTVVSGAWNDTLPGGATVSSIIADRLARFPNYICTMSGLTQNGGASTGNWQIDVANIYGKGSTVSANGYYTVVAQGPCALDIRCWGPYYQVGSPGTLNATERAFLYETLHLNPTTGAVEFISGQICEHQGLVNGQANTQGRAQFATFLGSTLLNGWGGNSGDGKTFTFDATAINTGTNTITLPGNNFCQGQLFRVSNPTGAFTAGLTVGTDYFACPASNGSSSVIVYSLPWGPIGGSTSNRGYSYTPPGGDITLSNTGSGSITLQSYSDWGGWSMNAMQPTGTFDWFGPSGAISYPLHVAHDTNYLLHTNRIGWPGFAGLPSASDNFPTIYAPGTTNCLQVVGVNGGGDNSSYGGSQSDFAVRRLQYPADPGYAQTHRCSALGQLTWNVWVWDPANGRIPAVNGSPKGPYTGLNQIPDVSLFPGFPVSNPLIARIGSPGVIGINNPAGPSHFWANFGLCYKLDGGQFLCDIAMNYGNIAMMEKQKDTGDFGSRNKTTTEVTPRTFWTCVFSAEPRSDAWAIMMMTDAWFAAPTEGPEASYPEAAYFNDVLLDHKAIVTYVLSSASMGSALSTLGGWPFENFSLGAPGFTVTTGLVNSGNPMTITEFMNGYCADAFHYAYGMCAHIQPFADQMATALQTAWNSSCPNFQFAYNWAPHYYEGFYPPVNGAISNAANIVAPNELGIVWNGLNGACFSEDGHTVYLLNQNWSPQINLANGVKIKFWDGNDVAGGGLFAYPPPEVQAYTYFYVHNYVGFTIGQTQISSFTLSTTDPTDTPVTWNDNTGRSTLAANISSSATSIPLNAALTTAFPLYAAAVGTATVTGGTTMTFAGGFSGTLNVGDLPQFAGLPEYTGGGRTYISAVSSNVCTLSQAVPNGTYKVINLNPGGVWLGTMTGGVITVTSLIAGSPASSLNNNADISAPGIAPNTQITANLGGGQWQTSGSQTLSGTQLFIANYQATQMTNGQALCVAKITTAGVDEWLSIAMLGGSTTMTALDHTSVGAPINGGGVSARGAYGPNPAAAHSAGDAVHIYPIVNVAAVMVNRTDLTLADNWPGLTTLWSGNTQVPIPGKPFSYMLLWCHAAAEAARLGTTTRTPFDNMTAMLNAMGMTSHSFKDAGSAYLSWSDPSA